MNGISGMNNTGKVDFSAALAEALKEKGIGEDGNTSVVLDGDNITITTRDPESGKEVSGTMKLPELKEGSEDEQVYAFLLQLADQFDQVAAELKVLAGELGLPEPPADDGEPTPVNAGAPATSDGSPATGSTSAQKAIFSIYDLINMMQKVAQQQRDSARNIRYSELENQKASIEAQAEYQRTAALKGLVYGAAMCVVQCAAAVATTCLSVSDLNKVDGTSAGKDINKAKSDLQTLKTQGDSEKAGLRTQEIEKKCSPEQMTEVETKLGECKAEKVEFEKAEADLNRYKELKSAQDKCQKEFDAAPGDSSDKVKLGEAKAKADSELQEFVNAHGGQENGKEPKLVETYNNARDAYSAKLDSKMAECNAQYEEASAKAKAAEDKYIDEYSYKPFGNSKNETAMKAALGEQTDLGAQCELMQAKICEAKTQMGYPKDTTKAELNLQNAKTMAAQDKTYMRAGHPSASTAVCQSLSQSLGGLGQNVAHFAQTNTEAKATEEQATQKEVEQHRDETNQLFQQAQDVINNLLGLLKAVIQAESQTMQAIIRA